MIDDRLELCRANLENLLLGESNVLNVADVEWLIAEVKRLRAKLDMDCGSCHPCMNWNAEVLRRALRALVDASLTYDEYAWTTDWNSFNAARDAAVDVLAGPRPEEVF